MRYLAVLYFCLLLCSSCIKKEKEPTPSGCIGSNFYYVKPFSLSYGVMDVHSALVDTLSAEFSIPVKWQIILEGPYSHARKEFSGHSKSFKIQWDGSSDNGIPFNQEQVKVSLIVPCKEPVVKTITIDNQRDYASLGTLISDFEGNGLVPNSTAIGYCHNCWSSYPNNGFISKFDIVTGPLTALQGDKYLTITAGDPSLWLTAGFYTPELPAEHSEPSHTYLNFMVNSGENTKTVLGVCIAMNGGKYYYDLPVNWSGWRMLSFKFSDFKNDKGESLPNLNSDYILEFSLSSGGAVITGAFYEVNMDLIMVTRGMPLNYIFYTTL